MPLDLRRFRQDPTLIHEWKTSQRARRQRRRDEGAEAGSAEANDNDNDNGNARWIDTALEQDLACRDLLKQAALCRGRIRRKETDQHGGDQQALLTATLAEYTSCQQALQSNLSRLANVVDTVVTTEHPFITGDTNTKKNPDDTSPTPTSKNVPSDPLFCLNGYQETRNALNSTVAACVLAGVGMNLEAALHQFIQSALQTQLPNTTAVQLPAAMPVTATHHHDVWGCCAPAHYCPACTSTATTNAATAAAPSTDTQSTTASSQLLAPAWMTFLLEHTNRIYYDRQLPVYSILSTISAATSAAALGSDDDGDKIMDPRESDRQASWRPARSKQRLPWHQTVSVARQIQMVALVGPSLSADSRPLLLESMLRIRDLYQQLVPHAVLCIRAVPAIALHPAEASRLVLEGTLPLAATASSSRPPVVCMLAHLGNFLDYCAGDIRHGTTNERLHVLQGTVCSLPETMEWVLQHGAGANEVQLPAILTAMPGSNLPATLPYQKTVTMGKNGKRIIRSIVRKDEKESGDSKQQLQLQQPPVKQLVGPMDNGLPQPSLDEIQLEAASTPFGFLPFYHR